MNSADSQSYGTISNIFGALLFVNLVDTGEVQPSNFGFSASEA